MKKTAWFLLLLIAPILFLGCPGVSPEADIYTLIYDGNGSTGGSVPTDPNSYEAGQFVAVLGNTGNLMKINILGASYRFAGWNTQADGNGTTYTSGHIFMMGGANVTLYAKWIAYILRDTGPAGGLIFYDKTYYSYGWPYLEAVPSDQSNWAEWGCEGTEITGADGTAIGTGEQNTIDIEADCTTSGTAADICANLEIFNNSVTYDDWFLLSRDELNLMYENLHTEGVGGFANYDYWSSSEFSNPPADELAYGQHFNYGNQFEYEKWESLRVRAVRAF